MNQANVSFRSGGENKRDGVLVNRSIEYITYDSKIKKYIRKSIFSYAFITNEEGEWQDDNTLMFQVIKYDNEPLGFEGTQWKSFIRRYSDKEIGHGLLTTRKGEEYRLYGGDSHLQNKYMTEISHRIGHKLWKICSERVFLLHR